MSSGEDEPGGARASDAWPDAPEAGRDAPRRATGDGATGHPWASAPGEWETCSPPPSVLYFRALVQRGTVPSVGEG